MNHKPNLLAIEITPTDQLESVLAATLAALSDLNAHLGNGLSLHTDGEGNWELIDQEGDVHHCEDADAALALLQSNAERYDECLELVDAQDRGAIQ